MTIDEYNTKLLQLKSQFNNDVKVLKRAYAFANNNVAIGDIVTGQWGAIQVTRIQTYLSNPSQCIYIGVNLKKDLTPYKNGKLNSILQCDVKEHKPCNSIPE